MPLRNLRTRIMFDMEPGLNQIDNNEVVRALERLLYTPSFFWPLSQRRSVSTLKDYLRDELCGRKPL